MCRSLLIVAVLSGMMLGRISQTAVKRPKVKGRTSPAIWTNPTRPTTACCACRSRFPGANRIVRTAKTIPAFVTASSTPIPPRRSVAAFRLPAGPCRPVPVAPLPEPGVPGISARRHPGRYDEVSPDAGALDGTGFGNFLDDNRIRVYGWINGSGNSSTNSKSNTPTAYWVVPNSIQLDQALMRIERQVDTVQTDQVDWGFRLTGDFGIDYRYFTAGGWFSRQLLVHNNLYGWDPTEVFTNIYVPGVAQGMILTVGRWVATPDIETQFAPDNYMGTHSLLFTVDVYTETGVMATVMLDEQWTVQAAIHAGADMAPWYAGAIPTGMLGVRWVSADNNDSFYTVLNAINNAKFRYFDVEGVPAGHHNYNIFQSTWQHRFTSRSTPRRKPTSCGNETPRSAALPASARFNTTRAAGWDRPCRVSH